MFYKVCKTIARRITRIPPIAVFALSLALGSAATYFAWAGKRAQRAAAAQAVTLKIANAVQDQLETFQKALLDTRSFLTADPKLGRAAYARFVSGLELPLNHPGLFSLGFARYVPRERRAQFLREVRAGGAPDFRIWPEGAGDLRVPVLYLEPMNEERRRVLGFDMWSEPVRRRALERAIATGVPVLSDRVQLLFRRADEISFMLVVPVFREGRVPPTEAERRALIEGFVFAPIRVTDFFNVIEGEQIRQMPGVTVEVFEGRAEPNRLLFAANARPPSWDEIVHIETVRIDRAGEWQVRVRARPSALGEDGFSVPLLVGIFGALSSLLIWFLSWAARASTLSLQKSQGLISLIADSLPALVAYLDDDRRYRYVNRAFTTWFGLATGDLLGKPVEHVFDQRFDSFLRPLLDRAFAGEGVEFEHAMMVRGRVRHLFSRYIPDVCPGGPVSGVVLLVEDVTEQRAVQDRLRDERRISELVNEIGLFLQSELEPNKLQQRIVNAATELTGAEVGRFAPEFASDSIVRIDDVQLAPGAPTDQLGWPVGRSPLRSYLAVPVISRRGEVLGGLYFGHARPGAFNERAENLVAGIAAQAAVALDNAKLYSESLAVNRLKDEFLATLSHELRTPLNVILGYSEILREEDLPPETLTHVDAIYRNAKSQNQLIADLLDISAIITGKLTFHPVRVSATQVIDQAVQSVRFAAEAKGLALEIRPAADACELLADPTRLQQIVWNLLSNAVKFTPPGGTVTIETRREGGACVIVVRDTGIGMEADFLPYVFDRFRQEDSTRSRRFGGLGLGLSIVRQLVEMHGGNIRVTSEGKGRGSCFTVTLPMA